MIMLEETPLISFDLKFNSMDTMKHAFLIMLFSSKKKKTPLTLIGCVISDQSFSYFKTQFAL